MNETSNLRRQFKMVLNRLFTIIFDSKEAFFLYSKIEWEEIIEEFCLDITIKGMANNTIKNYRSKLGNLGEYFTKRGIEPLLLKKSDVGRLILYLKNNGYQR